MSHLSRSTPLLLRVAFAAPLIVLAAFAGFGLFAAFELNDWSHRVPWLIGYALLGVGCVGGVIALVRPRRKALAADGSATER